MNIENKNIKRRILRVEIVKERYYFLVVNDITYREGYLPRVMGIILRTEVSDFGLISAAAVVGVGTVAEEYFAIDEACEGLTTCRVLADG